MAFSVDCPNEIIALSSDKEIDEMFKDCLKASKDRLVDETRKSIDSVSKSDLGKKVKATNPTKSKNGAFIMSAYPKGKTKDGKRAAEAAFYLNYGTSHQPARPWVDRANRNAESGCQEDIERRYNEWLDKKL